MAAVDFPSTCGKMQADSRKGLDEAGLLGFYLRSPNRFDARTEVR